MSDLPLLECRARLPKCRPRHHLHGNAGPNAAFPSDAPHATRQSVRSLPRLDYRYDFRVHLAREPPATALPLPPGHQAPSCRPESAPSRDSECSGGVASHARSSSWLSLKGCAQGGVAATIEQCVCAGGGLIWPGGLSGPRGGYLVLMELQQVVGCGDQPPFRARRRSASSLEAVDPAVCLVCANTGSTIALRRR